MLKFIRNVVLRTLIIMCVVAGVSLGGYGLSKCMVWMSTHVSGHLSNFGIFVKDNIPALVAVVIIVTIANVILEHVFKNFSGGKTTRKKKRRGADDDEEA